MTDITVEQENDAVVVVNDDLETIAVSATASVSEFDARADVEGVSIGSSLKMLRTYGYYEAGDGGGALYVRAGSEPSHAGKVQSADGAWWELSEHTHTPLMFGAKRSVSFDSSQAFENCFHAGCKHVIIPPGEYGFAGTAILSGTYRSVSGYGAVLKAMTSQVTILTLDGWWRGSLRGITFDSNEQTNCNGLEISDGGAGNNKYIDLQFWGTFDNAAIYTLINSSEDWSLWSNVMVFDATRGIVYKYGSGTGNVFNGGVMTPAEKGIAWLAENSQIVGDISIASFQFGGGANPGGSAFYVSPNAQYRANIAIVSSQSDAGIVKFVDAPSMRGFHMAGNNWGGFVTYDLTGGALNTIDYGRVRSKETNDLGAQSFDAFRLTLQQNSICRIDVTAIGYIGGVGARGRMESFFLSYASSTFSSYQIGSPVENGVGFNIDVNNGGDNIATITVSFTPTAAGTDFEVFFNTYGDRMLMENFGAT